MKLSVLIVGASGHGRVVLDIVRRQGHTIVGFLDDRVATATTIDGVEVLGKVSDVAELARKTMATAAIVAIGDNAIRQRNHLQLLKETSTLALHVAIHPAATIAAGVTIGAGSVVMPGAVLNSGARVGDGCIVNTGAVLDHDCDMGNFSSLAPGAIVGGDVRIGGGSAIGIGATIVHGCRIGDGVVIGAGAVVLGDIPDLVVAYGVPARVIRSRTHGEPYLQSRRHR